MKIEFTERDKEVIEMIKKGENNLRTALVHPGTEKCSVELEIHDPYKCDAFLRELFYYLEDTIAEDLGFKVKAVSLLGVASDFNYLKEDVMDKINEAVKEAFAKHRL